MCIRDRAEDEGVLLRAERAGMAVHIPLDVADRRGIEDAVDALDEIVPHLRLCEVEQQLVAAEQILPAEDVVQGPVGVPVSYTHLVCIRDRL